MNKDKKIKSENHSELKTAKEQKPEIIKKKFQGIVTSNKMDKTIVVKVDRIKKHPKYYKRIVLSKKYKVHDEQNKYKEGDKVIFIECRPISKDKRWRVIYS